jgi:hypothetical protein
MYISSKINAQKVYSKGFNGGVVYYPCINAKKKKTQQSMDTHMKEEENRLMEENKTTDSIFVRIGTGKSGIVKSFGGGADKNSDEHYNVVFDVNKPMGKTVHKTLDGVEIFSAPSDSDDQKIAPNIIQQPAAAVHTQEITTPMAVDAGIGTTAGPMNDHAPFVENPPAPVNTDELLQSLTDRMDDVRIAQTEGARLSAENGEMKERCVELEEHNKHLQQRITELEGVTPVRAVS